MMEKLEKFYREKFENHTEEPLPDAFDRIMQGMEKDGANTGEKIENPVKPYSSLLKISISLNALLMVAVPVVYYLASREVKEDTLSNTPQQNEIVVPASETIEVVLKENNSSVTISEKAVNRNISAMKTSESNEEQKNGGSFMAEEKENQIEETVATTKTEEASTTANNTVESVAQTVKEETSTSVPKKKKRNTDLYYEENASKLKDSTSLLFKKQK